MRIISGIRRGANLFSPKGEETRPTTDRVRENIFNLIQTEIFGATVLDLFSGSGAMGIEALSRGAEFCLFSDISKDAVEIIKKNIEKTAFNDKAEIKKASFEDVISSAKKKYSLVFLDPPYHKGYSDKAIKLLMEKELLSKDAVIVCETDYDEEISDFDGIMLIKDKTYGRIRVRIFRKDF